MRATTDRATGKEGNASGKTLAESAPERQCRIALGSYPRALTGSGRRDDSKRVYVELQANECSLHDARIMHGSEPNTSDVRRCGWTVRFCSTRSKFNEEMFDGAHVVYLAKGKDHAGNTYADPTRAYPEVIAKRGMSTLYKNSH